MVMAPVRLILARVSSWAAAGGAAARNRPPRRKLRIVVASSRRMEVSLLGQAVHEIHAHDGGAGRGHGPVVLLEERTLLAGAIHAREGAVDGEPEGRVARLEHESVGL